jgi:hypothetical protein
MSQKMNGLGYSDVQRVCQDGITMEVAKINHIWFQTCLTKGRIG